MHAPAPPAQNRLLGIALRVGAATCFAGMAAAIKLGSQLELAEMQFPHTNFAPVRQLLDQARDAATQAKARVSQERYREVAPAVEVSRTALQKAQQLLTKLTMSGK